MHIILIDNSRNAKVSWRASKSIVKLTLSDSVRRCSREAAKLFNRRVDVDFERAVDIAPALNVGFGVLLDEPLGHCLEWIRLARNE